MQRDNLGDMSLQFTDQRDWKQGCPVLAPLAVANNDELLIEIDILDP